MIIQNKQSDTLLNEKSVLEYIDFNNTGIFLHFNNESEDYRVFYNDIKNMKLTIKSEAGFRYDTITKFSLKIVLKDKEEFILLHNEQTCGLLDRIFQIIYYSKYLNDFEYQFTKKTKGCMLLDKAIKSYINNNYKHTFSSLGYTRWAIPVQIVTVLFLLLLLFVIGYFVATQTS